MRPHLPRPPEKTCPECGNLHMRFWKQIPGAGVLADYCSRLEVKDEDGVYRPIPFKYKRT